MQEQLAQLPVSARHFLSVVDAWLNTPPPLHPLLHSTTDSPIHLATPSTLPQIRVHEQPKSVVMHESSSMEQPALNVCAEIIGIPKGRDWGYSLGANFC